jgi:hypothetical protein
MAAKEVDDGEEVARGRVGWRQQRVKEGTRDPKNKVKLHQRTETRFSETRNKGSGELHGHKDEVGNLYP